jgi:DNA-nicking Smr family endonuclease
VIHGKGRGSGPRGPVLKHVVNHWLRRMDDVAAFATARPVDGGTGAVYVLLAGARRVRSGPALSGSP